MLYDTHVHSKFSHDGKSTIDEYAGLYPEKDKYCLGFAEHVDFQPEYSWCGTFEYDSYQQTVDNYRSQGYHYYAGAEIGYEEKIKDVIKKHLARHKYDYTICSVHMLNGIRVSESFNIEIFRDPVFFCDIIEKYYQEMFLSFRDISFDVMGHVGIYRRYLNESFYTKASLKLENELCDTLAEICADSDRLVEINTSGLYTPLGETLADGAFLRRYREKGGSYVCVGSDAHLASDTFRGFSKAAAMLLSLGFKYIYLPWDRERPIKLDQCTDEASSVKKIC